MAVSVFVASWLNRTLKAEIVFYMNLVLNDTVYMEKYLELFSEKYPHDLHIIQLDNVPLYRSLNLSIPENLIFLFQPAYSPELNPIEKLWLEIKKDLKWQIFENLDDLRKKLTSIIAEFSSVTIQSLGGWDFIFNSCITGWHLGTYPRPELNIFKY